LQIDVATADRQYAAPGSSSLNFGALTAGDLTSFISSGGSITYGTDGGTSITLNSAFDFFGLAYNNVYVNQLSAVQNGSLDISMTSPPAGTNAGFLFRTTYLGGEKTFGYCVFFGGSVIYLRKGANGTPSSFTDLVSVAGLPFTPGQQVLVSIRFDGPTISAGINGTTYFEVTDTSSPYLTAGYVGIATSGGPAASLVFNSIIASTGPLGEGAMALSWSDDGGRTFGNERKLSLGTTGEYKRRTVAYNLGYSRDRVYDLKVSDPVNRDIIGATLMTIGER
jgi:hypothetical protein